MRTLILGAAALSVCLSLGACGEVIPIATDAAVDAQEIDAVEDVCTKSQLSVDEFFTCLSRAVCQVYSDCIGSDTSTINCDDIPINVFGDLRPTAAKVVIAQASAAGRTQWNPTAAKACVDMLTTRGCGLFKNDSDVFSLCTALTGAVNNGQACQNDIECATPGAQCVSAAGGGGTNMCTGFTCRAPVPAGMMCTGGAFCRPEDHCVFHNQGADISFCATGEAGQACDDDGDCDVGNFCNGGLNNGSAMGICTAAKAAGSTCRTDEECMGELACVGNFGAVNGICRDVRAAGATCDTNSFAYACHGSQICETTASNVTGTCRPAVGLGDTCVTVGSTTPNYCGFFLACENGLCREPGGVGEACSRSTLFGGGFGDPNACNMGLFCDRDLTPGATMGVCREAQDNGAMCSRDSNCDSDSCQGANLSATPPVLGTCQTYPTCTF